MTTQTNNQYPRILITVGILIIGLYCLVYSSNKESFQTTLYYDTQYATNYVDNLSQDWPKQKSHWTNAPSCGNVYLQNARGSSKAGFHPGSKNCNVGETITITNQMTGGVQQHISCRITPKTEFKCSSPGCVFPPYVYSGQYQCKSYGSDKDHPYTLNVTVNNDTTDSNNYTDSRKPYPPRSQQTLGA